MAGEAVIPPPGSVAPAVETRVEGSKEGQPEFVKREDFNRLEHQLETVLGQLNHFSAAQRATEKQIQKQQQVTQTVEQEKLTLAGLKAEMDAKEKRLQERQITSAIADAAKAQGISDPRMLKLFMLEMKERYLQPEGKEKITLGANEEVVHLDGLDRATALPDFVKKWLATPDGQTYLPPTVTPGAVGQRSSQGQVTRSGTGDVQEFLRTAPLDQARATAQDLAKQWLQATSQG